MTAFTSQNTNAHGGEGGDGEPLPEIPTETELAESIAEDIDESDVRQFLDQRLWHSRVREEGPDNESSDDEWIRWAQEILQDIHEDENRNRGLAILLAEIAEQEEFSAELLRPVLLGYGLTPSGSLRDDIQQLLRVGVDAASLVALFTRPGNVFDRLGLAVDNRGCGDFVDRAYDIIDDVGRGFYETG